MNTQWAIKFRKAERETPRTERFETFLFLERRLHELETDNMPKEFMTIRVPDPEHVTSRERQGLKELGFKPLFR